jgi:azurin
VMQYSQKQLSVPADCKQVQLTLKHVGTAQARVMGHDWVLAKSSDVVAIANAGIAAGLKGNYLPSGDKRVIAATKIVGGGESATVVFNTAALQPGGDYTFFCSTPGHNSSMHGKFIFGPAASVASNVNGPRPR